jgi:hypothetical protein
MKRCCPCGSQKRVASSALFHVLWLQKLSLVEQCLLPERVIVATPLQMCVMGLWSAKPASCCSRWFVLPAQSSVQASC